MASALLTEAAILFVVHPHGGFPTVAELTDTFRLRITPCAEQALQYLRETRAAPAAIAADHRSLRHIESALSSEERQRLVHVVWLLLTDGLEPSGDFAAINRVAVFRVLETSASQAAIRKHLREAMERHAERSSAPSWSGHGGSALRETLSFLAHEINSPLSLIQGYTQALLQRSGAFSSMPPTPDIVRRALEASDRSARRCLNLMSLLAETTQSAFPRGQCCAWPASDLLRAFLETYPFAGNERDWIRLRIEQDFELPSRPELLHLVLFTLMRQVLQARRHTVRPSLEITLETRGGVSGIRWASDGNHLSIEEAGTGGALQGSAAQTTGLAFCRRVMHALNGVLHLPCEPCGGTIALLSFKASPDGNSIDPV